MKSLIQELSVVVSVQVDVDQWLEYAKCVSKCLLRAVWSICLTVTYIQDLNRCDKKLWLRMLFLKCQFINIVILAFWWCHARDYLNAKFFSGILQGYGTQCIKQYILYAFKSSYLNWERSYSILDSLFQ